MTYFFDLNKIIMCFVLGERFCVCLDQVKDNYLRDGVTSMKVYDIWK